MLVITRGYPQIHITISWRNPPFNFPVRQEEIGEQSEKIEKLWKLMEPRRFFLEAIGSHK